MMECDREAGKDSRPVLDYVSFNCDIPGNVLKVSGHLYVIFSVYELLQALEPGSLTDLKGILSDELKYFWWQKFVFSVEDCCMHVLVYQDT